MSELSALSNSLLFALDLIASIAKLIAEGGASTSPSVANLHRAYVVLEVIKAFGLILLIAFQLLELPLR